ncbi:MAG TPA: D-alanyl-D-alanine carboxypeptidase, partial [Thermoanaerobaculia bacterium]
MRRLLIVLLLAGCATTTPKPTAFDPQIPAELEHALWSVLIEEDDGTVLYAQNAGKLMIPASNRKLFAAATIASCLGIDTRLSTNVYRDG